MCVLIPSRILGFGLILSFGLLGACNTPPSSALIPNDLSPLVITGSSATGAKFVFDVNGHCPDVNTIKLMVIEALKMKGACENGFVMIDPHYSPPSCSVAVQCVNGVK